MLPFALFMWGNHTPVHLRVRRRGCYLDFALDYRRLTGGARNLPQSPGRNVKTHNQLNVHPLLIVLFRVLFLSVRAAGIFTLPADTSKAHRRSRRPTGGAAERPTCVPLPQRHVFSHSSLRERRFDPHISASQYPLRTVP